ncbi:DNA recombination protein RmuC [Marinobacter sediminum]|uniref:DNA recombination protein RmuC n=1 Tax=Marinobacter sediminum TaxID=256323 RepID=UPI003EBBE79E
MPEAVTELLLSQPDLMAGWIVVLVIAVFVLAGLTARAVANKRKLVDELAILDRERQEAENLLQNARHQEAMDRQQAEYLERALDEQKARVIKYEQDIEQWRQQASGLENRVAGLESDLEGRKHRISQLEGERQIQQHRADGLAKELHQAQVELREQEVTLDRERRSTSEKLELLERNRDALKQEFENLANKIFEQKSERFSQQTRTSLDTLLTPFRDQLQDFRKRVEDVYTTETRDRQALRSEIKSLQDLNRQITEEASNLTRALKGDKKIQGNWGELILERVLEKSGLRKGVEYDTQGSYRDSDNQLLRPDVVVHLPDSRNLIIDSKVSLVAYQQWVTEEDDTAREAALQQHVEAVRNHIRTLSEKDYSQLNGLHSPDFVLLFMPIEPAFVAAFQQDENLFAEAFERKIIVVTPTTLLATLRTIENIWRYERQSQNARRIADRAGAVYDKLRVFVEAMERLGGQLHTAQGSYDSAMNTLTRGRGNLISQANRFVELGVRVKKELPKAIMDQAEVDVGDESGDDEHDSPETEEQAIGADNQQE